MAKKKRARDIAISDAESLVMQAIWDRGPLTTDDVMAALGNRVAWSEATVKTLLNRLLNKGAISAEKDGRRYVYSAVLAREDWLANESHGFLDRLFNGRVAPLVSYFSQHRGLSKEDVAELKRLIKELDNGQ